MAMLLNLVSALALISTFEIWAPILCDCIFRFANHRAILDSPTTSLKLHIACVYNVYMVYHLHVCRTGRQRWFNTSYCISRQAYLYIVRKTMFALIIAQRSDFEWDFKREWVSEWGEYGTCFSTVYILRMKVFTGSSLAWLGGPHAAYGQQWMRRFPLSLRKQCVWVPCRGIGILAL